MSKGTCLTVASRLALICCLALLPSAAHRLSDSRKSLGPPVHLKLAGHLAGLSTHMQSLDMTLSCTAKPQSSPPHFCLEHTAQDVLARCCTVRVQCTILRVDLQLRFAACSNLQESPGAAAGAASEQPPRVAIAPAAPGLIPRLRQPGASGAADGPAPQGQPLQGLVTPAAPGWRGMGPRAGGPMERNGAPGARVSWLPAKRVLSNPVMHTGTPCLQRMQEKNMLPHQSVTVRPAGQPCCPWQEAAPMLSADVCADRPGVATQLSG